MRGLLDASSQRIIKILELFSAHEGWITLSDLSLQVGASERTVAQDLASLKKQWGKKLKVESSKKNGIRLLNLNSATIGLIFTDLFNQSVALCWIKELLFYPDNTLEFYQEKLFTSRSTLIRLYPKINKVFASRGLSIRCRNKRYRFIGHDEQYLRDFCASFLLELYGLDPKNYAVELDLKVIYGLLVSALTKNLEPPILAWVLKDDIPIAYQLMFYIISLVREEQGYCIHSDYPVENDIDPRAMTCLQQTFPHLTINNLRPIHQQIYNRYNGWSSQTEHSLVTSEAKAFLTRLCDTLVLSPNEDTLHLLQYVLEMLYLNAKARTHKTSVLFDRVYYFSLSLKREHPALYKILWDNIVILSQNTGIKTRVIAHDIVFWLCLTYPELCQFSMPKNALLISDFGSTHAAFLVNLLSSFCNKETSHSICFDAVSTTDAISKTQLKSYDAVITTVPDLQIAHKQIFLIHDYPSYHDLCAIYKALLS